MRTFGSTEITKRLQEQGISLFTPSDFARLFAIGNKTPSTKRFSDWKKAVLCIVFLASQYLSIFVSPVFASDNLYFIHTDHLGSTVAVTDEDGEVVSQTRHFPYGEDRIPTDSERIITERNYTSQIRDQETSGLYYYNARYYDSALGTFVSADPVNDSLNRFAYVGNNPIMVTDPSGHAVYAGGGGYEDESYGSQVFVELFENYLATQDEVGKSVLAGDMWTIEDKIFTIGRFVEHSGAIPYAPVLTEFEERYHALEERRRGVPYLPLVDTSWVLASFEELRYEMLGEKSEILQKKAQLSPVGRYREGLFQCSEFTDLTSAYVQRYLPDVPVYAAGLPGHAIVIFEGTGGEFMMLDSTPRGPFNPFPTPLRDVIVQNPGWEWDKLGYNPAASSPLASEASFREGVRGALETLRSRSRH